MGRKPNPVILEFFERGPKLEDSSNRYQHTCKACGEKFPKGRIDSLTTHITKKCQVISQKDRKRALAQLFDISFDAVDDLPFGGKTTMANGKAVNLPFTPSKANNGLEVLAEASRQITEKSIPPSNVSPTPPTSTSNPLTLDPALQSQSMHVRTTSPELNGLYSLRQQPPTFTSSGPYAMISVTAPSTTPFMPSSTFPESPISSPELQASAFRAAAGMVSYPQQPSRLSRIAASANEMEASLSSSSLQEGRHWLSSSPTNVPIMSTDTTGFQRIQALAHFDSPIQQGNFMDIGLYGNTQQLPQTDTQSAAQFPRPIAMNPNTSFKGFSDEFSVAHQQPRQKVRGRFTPSRRKEVQEVRKMGACLRCRMLKKPCSGEDPCTTCQNVESARLWRSPCIRAKLAEEIDLFTTRLYYTLSFHNVNSMKSKYEFVSRPGRVEAMHFDDSNLIVTFNLLMSLGCPAYSNIDPTLSNDENSTQPTNSKPLWMLDDKKDDNEISGRLDRYLKKMASTYFEKELSPFMRETLITASRLHLEHHDKLLIRALDLWVATHVLTDSDLHWNLFSNPNQSPLLEPETGVFSPSNSQYCTYIDQVTNAESYNTLCLQLRAAAELRANELSKIVLSEIEKRLLQRQQSSLAFSTLLAAVVLLNCVERYTWLYNTWENEKHASKWPLDRRPADFANKSERFSDILIMLLKIRNLQPKTVTDPESGFLKHVSESTKDTRITVWVNSWHLKSQDLVARSQAVCDIDDSRSLDFKFTAKLLSPASSS
ncbi:MAG: hypothetical protein M1834_005747 [Cirrosporium novae-zelandiae]|nr:MAG: hypothetical protein M1834_005747 [Cirrosporium novae-zelandiae]